MSTAVDDCPFGDERCAPPSFELASTVDDPDDPGEVTVFPADADDESLVTTWISVDPDGAVPLEDVR